MSSPSIQPIFLFSLPRAGSTLLQRLIAQSPEVSTCPEPWLMLPLVYAFERRPIFSEYNCLIGGIGLQELTQRLPEKEEDVEAALRDFALGVYGKLAEGNTRFFLDKTPRYSTIAPSLVRIFPQAKFIFLWRNPLAVIASNVRSLWRNRFQTNRLEVDLQVGVPALLQAAETLGPRGVHVRYEELVQDPERHLGQIAQYLEVDAQPLLGSLENIPKMEGRLGDPTGQSRYAGLQAGSVANYADTCSGFLRKRWIKRCLRRLPDGFFERTGISREVLLQETRALPNFNAKLHVDCVDIPLNWMHCHFDLAPQHAKFRTRRFIPRN
ncbi:MAG: sulfotransferase [Opitutales bacterium]